MNSLKALVLLLLTAVFALPAASEPAQVRLEDYAFDFPTYGYEITVTGETRNFTDTLTANDYITIDDGGYTLKSLIDRMERRDRQQFISFFNEHCVTGFMGDPCAITASGDIELDEDMRMIFRISAAIISKGSNQWSSAPEGN